MCEIESSPMRVGRGVSAMPQLASRMASRLLWTPATSSSARNRMRRRTCTGPDPSGRAVTVASRSTHARPYASRHDGSSPAAPRCSAESSRRRLTTSHGPCSGHPSVQSELTTAEWPAPLAAASRASSTKIRVTRRASESASHEASVKSGLNDSSAMSHRVDMDDRGASGRGAADDALTDSRQMAEAYFGIRRARSRIFVSSGTPPTVTTAPLPWRRSSAAWAQILESAAVASATLSAIEEERGDVAAASPASGSEKWTCAWFRRMDAVVTEMRWVMLFSCFWAMSRSSRGVAPASSSVTAVTVSSTVQIPKKTMTMEKTVPWKRSPGCPDCSSIFFVTNIIRHMKKMMTIWV